MERILRRAAVAVRWPRLPFRRSPSLARARLVWWNLSFFVAFALLGLLGAWWTILITRLVNQNYALALSLGGAAQHLTEEHARQRLMILGESATLLSLALSLIFLAWRQAQRERTQIRRLEGMLAASTHELKTPVAAVRSLLESLETGVLPPERAGPYLIRGLEACSRLEHLIESILTYQAAVARPTACSVMPTDHWVLPVVQHRRETMTSENIKVDLGEAGKILVSAAADPVRVILENLLDNAQKYGGGEVKISAEIQEHWLELQVQDQGSGFPPEEAELLFEPYQRGQSGQPRHGTGLGLYLARSLARAMGGELRASSPGVGKGATFHLRLLRER